MKQKKYGILIRYFNTVLDFLIAIFFTPYLLRTLGDAEYGLYRIVQSFAGQLGILSFGMATLVARNVVRYNTINEEKQKENFLATSGIVTLILTAVVFGVGVVLSFSINSLFDATLTAGELVLAKKLFWILIANVAVSIISDYPYGILIAHEKFIQANGMTTIRQFIRIAVLIALLQLGYGALAIVLTDLIINILLTILKYIYGFVILKEKAVFYYFDKTEFKISLTFSFAIFLQAIVNQVNQNLDNVILGAMTSTETVAMYSVALSLFTMFSGITMVFGNVFVPQATRMVTNGASGEELTDLVIKPGRLAVMVGNLLITGFVLFGREFIDFWVGPQYEGAYLVTIILMIPGMLPLMQNVTNSILDAMLKRLGRSVILVAMAFINIIVSVILVKFMGYIGAAIGTAFSFTVGYLVFINLHLKKNTTLNLPRMYKELLMPSFFVSVGCMIVASPLMLIKSSSRATWAVKVVIYAVLYCVAMYFLAMRGYEKILFTGTIMKIFKKREKPENEKDI